MTNFGKDLQMAAKVAGVLFFLAAIFQLVDGGFSSPIIFMSCSAGCVLIGYSLKRNVDPEKEEGRVYPISQVALYALAALLLLAGLLVGLS